MGMFDDVAFPPGMFFCSMGHDLHEHGENPTCGMQTKDYACAMGLITIGADRSVTQQEGFGGWPMIDAELEKSWFQCYTSCTACPAFVSMNGVGHVHLVWCEFHVTVRMSTVTEIKYVSKTTAEFIEETPHGTYMNGESWKVAGPMPYAEATQISKQRWQDHCDLRNLEIATIAWLHDAGDEQPGTEHFYCHAGFPPRSPQHVVIPYMAPSELAETVGEGE